MITVLDVPEHRRVVPVGGAGVQPTQADLHVELVPVRAALVDSSRDVWRTVRGFGMRTGAYGSGTFLVRAVYLSL